MSLEVLKKAFSISALTFLTCASLHADIPNNPSPSETYTPWLTGTLISLPGTVTPVGLVEIEPYFYTTVATGRYNHHWKGDSAPNFCTFNPFVFVYVGLTEWMDFEIVPQVVSNFTQGQSSVHFGDLLLGFDFQLVEVNTDSLMPAVKFSLLELFPTGNYQKLDPKKLETDVSGLGSFGTQADLIFYKVFHIKEHHFLSATLTLEYNVFAPVHVKGYNVYGGGEGTHGRIFPGNAFEGVLSFEYSLNQNWVLAFDAAYLHANKNRFSGNQGSSATDTSNFGIAPFGAFVNIGRPSFEQFSIAPAIEYNFSERCGMIAGSWFSVGGRNSPRFASGTIAVDFVF